MLEVKYSFDEEIYISGSSKEIEDFRLKVLEFLKTHLEKTQIKTCMTTISDPYEFIAKGLEIILTNKPVKVSVSDNKIVKIEGSKENLYKFSSFWSLKKIR